MFEGCFICRSWRLVTNFTGSKSLLVFLPSSISIWQLPRQFAIVLRFVWKERALVEVKPGCLIGQGSGSARFMFRAFGGQARTSLWFTSWNALNEAVLCQVNQSFVVKHNKAFKSDSQRLAVSLRSSIAKRRSHLNAALYRKGEINDKASKRHRSVALISIKNKLLRATKNLSPNFRSEKKTS